MPCDAGEVNGGERAGGEAGLVAPATSTRVYLRAARRLLAVQARPRGSAGVLSKEPTTAQGSGLVERSGGSMRQATLAPLTAVVPSPHAPGGGPGLGGTDRTGFRLLGPLSVTHGDEAVILPAGKPTSLLAALLLHPNLLVSTDRLKQVVWGEVRPAAANTALHTCVRRLRRVLADHGLPADTIGAVSGGYRIGADAGTLDLIRFRDLTRAARREAAPETRLRLLRRALAEWQGPLLANVASDAVHRDEVPLLTEERLSVTEQAVDIELAAGHCREVLAELWALTRAYPERERFWEQLIEALYRSGRQAEALAEYRGVKGHLADELGVDPGPALQRLELAILRGDPLGPLAAEPVTISERDAVARTAPPATARPVLPSPLATVPSFTGRGELGERILRRVHEAAPGPVTVLVCGAPGIGKSALALHVASAVPGEGARAAVRMTAPDGSPRRVEDLVGELRDADWPATDPVGSVLVLDDVVEEETALAVLDRSRPAVALLTSRQSLAGLAAHRHLDLVCRPGPFAPEESAALLTGVLGADRVEREPEAVARLAAVCRQFPLALRLAATRLLTRPLLRVSDYVDWLAADPVPRLSLGLDHRLSVSTVLATALDRLPGELAEAFVRLGAVGGCASGLAPETLAGPLGMPPDAAAETLERLADAGFLEQDRAGRFHMHALLHDYAAVRLGAGAGTDPATTPDPDPTTDPSTDPSTDPAAVTRLRPRPEETPDEYRAG